MIGECIINETKNSYISTNERAELEEQVFNSLRRLDILQPLLEDPNINEIMVNGYNNIFVESEGVIKKLELEFDSEERFYEVIQNIVSKANRQINEGSPIVDARLEDGSRVNVVLNPLSIGGHCLTIRKFPPVPFSLKDLFNKGMFDAEAEAILNKIIIERKNFLISGGTSTGKTTLLNALLNSVSLNERVIVVEDSAELNLNNIENLVRLETRRPNHEGKGEVTMRQLVKNALRMRPDRLIVGEVRDEAAIEMLEALNTGHEGSASTIHANSAEDALTRLETILLSNSGIPLEAIRRQIISSIHIIIHLERDNENKRRLKEILEVEKIHDEKIHYRTVYTEKG